MRKVLITALVVQLSAPASWGWGAAVHEMVTLVALETLPKEGPGWLQDPVVQRKIAFQSNQPDRWRGWNSPVLAHENDPEHYLDVERLAEFGVSLDDLPRLRRQYLVAMAIARHEHPQRVSAYDPTRDPAGTQEWPGFLPYAIAEQYAKLQAAFNQVRILERLDDPGRAIQLEQARAVVIECVGNLAHFVADAAQPLHTTHHYNGWRGPNPAGYRWRERFHAYVDEAWPADCGIDAAALRLLVRRDLSVDPDDPWRDILALLARSHARVEQLYALERDGRLDGPEGGALAVEQLADAVNMVHALIWAAWKSSEPTDEQIARWVKYDPLSRALQSRPASQPAAAP